MAKRIVYDVKPFTGWVDIKDPIPYIATLKISEAIQETNRLAKEEKTSSAALLLYPALLECVEAWEVNRVPKEVRIESLPGSPKAKADAFIAWLVQNIVDVYLGTGDIDPNE